MGLGLPEGLECLILYRCPALKFVAEGLFKHAHIRKLNIWDCSSLKLCSSHKDCLPTPIESFEVMRVKKMELPRLISSEQMQLYSSLSSLDISNDVGLVSFHLGVLLKLRSLRFSSCENLGSIYIPEGRGIAAQNGLMSLYKLTINNCLKLEYVVREGLPAPNLEELSFYHCENLKSLPSGMYTQSHTSLLFES
ncbi:hypothetical protein Ancab_001847 [Ancistrocladus abbreviatus]